MGRAERRRKELEERKRQKKARRETQNQLNESQTLAGLQVETSKTTSNSKNPFKTIQEEQEADERAAIAFLKTIRRLLPGLLTKLSKVKDFRNPKKTKHKVAVILLSGLLSFVFQKSSRRQANRGVTTPIFIENLKRFFPDLEALPHHDTINRFLAAINIIDLEQVHIELIKHFIVSKKFTRYLLDNCYPIAIDGSQKYTYDFLWAEECQRRETNGKEQYYCYSLDASLSFHNGMIIPVATEFLDYMEGDVDTDKQDCETRAFSRLAEKLKGFFPRLRFMVLLDGLYPNGKIFELCTRYKWQYMIVLQDNSLKSVWEEFNALKDLEEDNKVNHIWGNRYQKFTWVNEISYLYDKMRKEQIVHVVVCEENWDEVADDGSIVNKYSKHAWISSEPLSKKNVHERCNLGARYRWGIENGFLVEKKYGYHYEHAFSFNWNAMKGYHILMRMAHMINILAQYGSLLKGLFSKKGIMAAIKYLDEIFRKTLLDTIRVMKAMAEPYQIRFG